MNKEFIPYTEALALKELGFNEPCLGAFIGKELKIFSFSNDLKGYTNDANLIIGAATYQQAFRFFREKYNLTWEHQFDDSNISLYVGEIAYPDNNLDFFKIIEVEYDGYNKAHEEAELACLIKLIEIVKNK
jgi:hypothetical protein